MTRIALIGGGGFAKEVWEIAELCGHEVVAYVGTHQDALDRPYWGEREALEARRSEFDAVCIAFGMIDRRTLAARAETVAWFRERGLPAIALVSPSACVAKGAVVGEGCVVAHRAVLSVDCRLDAHCIVNTGAIVGHDAKLGVNASLAPGSFIGGNVVVGANTLVGPGAIVLQQRTIGEKVVVGVGATVARNVPDGATVKAPRSTVVQG